MYNTLYLKEEHKLMGSLNVWYFEHSLFPKIISKIN